MRVPNWDRPDGWEIVSVDQGVVHAIETGTGMHCFRTPVPDWVPTEPGEFRGYNAAWAEWSQLGLM